MAGPILSALKVRRVFRAIEAARDPERLKAVLHSEESQDVAVELLAAENRIPKFLAKKLYTLALRRLAGNTAPPPGR